MTDIRVCPNCGSEDVAVDRTGMAAKLGLDYGYKCGRCGFSGKLFPMIDADEVEDHREALREEKDFEEMDDYVAPDPEVSSGRFMMGLVMLVLGLGSLPVAMRTLTGAIGALLVPIGLSVMYREVTNARSEG